MNLKEFLKPTLSKILLTIILFSLSWFYIYEKHLGIDAGFVGRGLPFPFYTLERITIAGSCCPGIIWVGVISDLIFYYIISLFLMMIYEKIRNK